MKAKFVIKLIVGIVAFMAIETIINQGTIVCCVFAEERKPKDQPQKGPLKESDPLSQAIIKKSLAAFKAAVAKGADINQKLASGKTPLMIVIERDLPEFTKFLIEKKADLNVRDKSENGGKTALTIAKEKGDQEIVKILTDAGAQE